MNRLNIKELNTELIGFIEKSASMFHTVKTISDYLNRADFHELKESENWILESGGKYYVKKNNSSIIAFTVGNSNNAYFKITASHSDSPTFAVKAVPELEGPGNYLRLNVEGYGGMISYSWLDRPLGIAGRVMVKSETENGMLVQSRLINPDKDLFMIPSLCIHFNREANKGMEFNNQVDMCPLASAGEMAKGDFREIVAKEAGTSAENILGWNLYLVNRQKGTIWGAGDEFVSAAKLDDLQSAFTSLKGFIAAASDADKQKGINVLACFDNEEVGSGTKQGADSTFLADTLRRIIFSSGGSEENYLRAVSKSFMVSFDNAHALHPNHPEKSDSCNTPVMNKGIVIKENASQKYCTDAFSRSLFSMICEKAGVPCQVFANRSNIAGGSTLGNISNAHVSVHGVDIGLAQLAMHSAYETAGAKDTAYAVRAIEEYYRSQIDINGSDSFRLV